VGRISTPIPYFPTSHFPALKEIDEMRKAEAAQENPAESPEKELAQSEG